MPWRWSGFWQGLSALLLLESLAAASRPGARTEDEAGAIMSECSECGASLTPRQQQRGGVVCSRRCSGRRIQRTLSDDVKRRVRMTAANAMYRNLYYRRVVQAIVADLKPHVINGLVSFAAAVKVAVKARREGYDRGYGACYRRGRRASDAELWERKKRTA